MTALISDAVATLARTQLVRFLVHAATLTPRVAGTADSEGNIPYTDGTPVTGVACKYVAEDRVTIDNGGQTLVSVPTLTVAWDQTVAAGSKVGNVQDSDGTVLLVGPATVQYVVASAGLGPTLKKKLVLRFGDVR